VKELQRKPYLMAMKKEISLHLSFYYCSIFPSQNEGKKLNGHLNLNGCNESNLNVFHFFILMQLSKMGTSKIVIFCSCALFPLLNWSNFHISMLASESMFQRTKDYDI